MNYQLVSKIIFFLWFLFWSGNEYQSGSIYNSSFSSTPRALIPPDLNITCSTMSEEECARLRRFPTIDEIHKIVSEMSHRIALDRSRRFTVREIDLTPPLECHPIGSDLIVAIVFYFWWRHMLKVFNHTYQNLISKKDVLTQLCDYRPISCVKILANE